MTCTEVRNMMISRSPLDCTRSESIAAFHHWTECAACQEWAVAMKGRGSWTLGPGDSKAINSLTEKYLRETDPEAQL